MVTVKFLSEMILKQPVGIPIHIPRFFVNIEVGFEVASKVAAPFGEN